jgi:hypothetical protein
MPRGRIPSVPIEEQISLFTKYIANLQDVHIKYNNPIFLKMSQEINGRMSSKALHMSFLRHRCSISTENLSSDVIDTNPSIDTTTTADSVSAKESVNNSSSFSFDIDVHEWEKIKPVRSIKKRCDSNRYRTYLTLPKFKWSTMLKENIWLNSKLPCTWVLKTSKISSEQVVVKGHCSQCNAQINVNIFKRTHNFHTASCSVSNFCLENKHNVLKKSKLSPYKRQKLAKILKHRPAIAVHKDLASELLSEGPDDLKNVSSPPVLPTVSALRKIKSDERIGRQFHNDVVLSLLTMSHDDKYKNLFRQIITFPNFTVHFWSQQQVDFYKVYCETTNRSTITIDATGSIFKAVSLPNGATITKRLFLYQGLITCDKNLRSVPIFQMVTDSHSHVSICNWLRIWNYSVDGMKPQEVITDDCAALISAVITTFTEFTSTKTYIEHLFYILSGTNLEMPPVYVRLDTSHFIKTLHNLPCLQGIDNEIKLFYIRCIYYLKKCEDFDNLKSTIKDILDVCYSKKISFTKRKLDSILKNKDVCFPPLDDNEHTESIDFVIEEHEVNNDFFSWFDKEVLLKKNNNDNHDTDAREDNPFYLPTIAATLRRILFKLPLWSNILVSHFKSDNLTPSSAGVESFFKTIKHLIFKTKTQKYRIDEFIQIFAQYIEGDLKSSKVDLENGVTNKVVKKTGVNRRKRKHSQKKQIIKKAKLVKVLNEDSVFSDKPSLVENWRGEGTDDDTATKILKQIKHMQNGNLCSTVEVNNRQTKIINTCGLDSTFFLLCFGYIQNQYIHDLINMFSSELISMYIKCLAGTTISYDPYKIRADLALKHYFKESLLKLNNDVVIVDCQSNVASFHETVLLNHFYSALFSKRCVNEFCTSISIERQFAFLPLNLDMLSVFGIESLEDAICFDESSKLCLHCGSNVSVNYELHVIITVDLNGTGEHCLLNIPYTIRIKSKVYELIGAIEFVPPPFSDSIGHYKCHVLINSNFQCYDDNKRKIEPSLLIPITLHLLIYAAI